jgi:L-alanine-DL-glutamate epimerase-like enolase superfamily enzyme
MPMKIAEVETIPFALRFAEPYVTARGTLERREMALFRVRTDEGAQGVGEAVPLTLRGGADLGKVAHQLQRVGRRLRGTDVSDMEGEHPLAAAIDFVISHVAGRRLASPARAAVEQALFDLAGRISGEPLWRLLGADEAGPVLCNATLPAGPPEAVARRAEEWTARGFGSLKLKLGVGDDLRQVEAVRTAVGPEARIRVDANGSWSTDEALDVLREIESLGIELVEQPTDSLRSMAAVTRATPIPVAADESVTGSKEAARAARAGACRLATVKLAKVGGIGPSGGIARELPSYLSSALDGPVGIAAAAHLAQALYRGRPDPGLAHGLATQLLFAESIAVRECEVTDGRLVLPEGPGLGVELDESALQAARLSD